jgi:serine/threonine protein kinase
MGDMPLPGPPQRLGRYEIEKEVGRGMMGVVYEARDTLLGRTVALKTISLALAISERDRQAFERRFLDEARAAAALSHPHIVVVYDVGSAPEAKRLYMALEYLRGRTLESMLSSGQPLDWRQAVRLAAQLADALSHAHGQGVIHRDVKPANIMVLESGDLEPEATAKIMDFGVAKLEASGLTTGGQILGSPSYMSPEQAAGERIDSRTDIFALGAVLYEMLTGRKAFAGPNVPAILLTLAQHDPAPPSTLVPTLPAALDGIVARALAKSVEARYVGGLSFREDLEEVLAGRPPRHASPPPTPGPTTLISKDAAPRKKVGEDTAKTGSAASALALPLGRRVSLAILEGARQGDMFPLGKPRALIGREGGGTQADIELPDPEVSRAHALVECYGARVVLRDLESRNGTYVAEERIREAELENQSEFRVGRTRFMLILADKD